METFYAYVRHGSKTNKLSPAIIILNRDKISRRAVRGLGGGGMLVRLTLFHRFKIQVLDSSYEGILS